MAQIVTQGSRRDSERSPNFARELPFSSRFVAASGSAPATCALPIEHQDGYTQGVPPPGG